jgi:hypothetical protein
MAVVGNEWTALLEPVPRTTSNRSGAHHWTISPAERHFPTFSDCQTADVDRCEIEGQQQALQRSQRELSYCLRHWLP